MDYVSGLILGSLFLNLKRVMSGGTKRNQNCCRCFRPIPLGTELGGTFGGVVCIYHRACQDCWWESTKVYGKRLLEPENTKFIALVKGPRSKKRGVMGKECFGCLYNTPDHTSAQERWIGNSGTVGDHIIISSDEEN